MKHLVSAIIVAAMLTFVSCTKSAEAEETRTSGNAKEELTLCGNVFLRGKVRSIVEDDDSMAFVYNSNRHVVGFVSFTGGKQTSECKYYSTGNGVSQCYFDSNGKVTARDDIEYNENNDITLCEYREYIYPDTTAMQLAELVFNSYDKENRLESTFEYFCDGIPSYFSRYTYDADGTATRHCYIASSGHIYSVAKSRCDSLGNIVEMSENMPGDSQEWYSTAIEYKYDSHGNWVERRVIDRSSGDADAVEVRKRKIYYLDE